MVDGIAFSWELRPRTAVVALSGELDVMTAPELPSGLQPLLQDPPPVQLVVLDLSRLAFLGWAGVRALAAVVRDLRDRDVTACFVSPRGTAVSRTLDLAGTAEFIDVFRSRQDALVHHVA
ncbi:STAS domain-containing protein [Amycolatopsis sp. 195334CR]|uniref:STAS domain-containing protein n=1 Tax=Amycolatopsis sp. 195334CR TaxID=2814588 RepID=UPI001A901E84|nr:STAS domain-containing protein [Amycolatopsis sp. 195334CR]MBN6040516.1 STAS domain-containing protein [Amycolatopsis sp. 195334CR]